MSLSAGTLKGKPKFVKEPLALPDAKSYAVARIEVVRKEPSVPEVLVVTQGPRGSFELLPERVFLRFRKPGRPSRAVGLPKHTKALGGKTVHPVLDASWRVSVNPGRLVTAVSAEDEKHHVQAMVVSTLRGRVDLVFNRCCKGFRIGDRQSSHREATPPCLPVYINTTEDAMTYDASYNFSVKVCADET